MRRMDLLISDTDPVNGTDQVYSLTNTATGGTFKFGHHYRKSTAVAIATISAATLQTALRTLPNWETSTVTGTGPWVITALGAVGKANQGTSLKIVDNLVTGGTTVLATTTPGVDSTLRGQRVPAMIVGPTGTAWVSSGNSSAPGWVKVGTQT